MVRVDAVRKRYDDVEAVRGVDLDIVRGEFLTLLGPSGCGKTTLLRMIAGFEEPTSGRILINGADVTSTPTYRRPIGMVLQNLALFPHLNVGENIAFGLQNRREARVEIDRKVQAMLAMVGLAGYERRLVHQLSGGQKQRVALARSLVTEPSVLLLDEPLGALDLKLRQQLQDELKRIQRRVGITFVFVTHDQEEAMSMSDRIAVMNNGVVEQLGTSQQIFETPASLFVANFIGDTNVFAGQIVSLSDRTAKVRLDDFGAIVSATGSELNLGDRVGVVVRPDYAVLDAACRAEGALAGVVTDRTFIGATQRYRVQIGDGEGREVKVRRPHRAGDPVFDVGQSVAVTWRESDGVAVKSARDTAF